MISCCTIGDEGRAVSVQDLESVRVSLQAGGAPVWIDLEDPTETELREVGDVLGFTPHAMEDCLHGDQRPRVDAFPDHIFMLLYAALGIRATEEFARHKLALFCGRSYLVTVHRYPLRSINALRHRCENGDNLMRRGPDRLLYLVVDSLVDNYLALTETYERRLESLEERALNVEYDHSVLGDAADLRGDALELRRVVVAQRDLLAPLARGEVEFVSEELGQHFQHVLDHLTMAIEIVDDIRELLNGVRDTYHSALTIRTNEIVRILTIFASILLPLSVIAGIFGMNVSIWPNASQPWSFVFVLALMAAVGLGMVVFFRHRRWL